MEKQNPEAGDHHMATARVALTPELMAQQRADLCDLINLYEPMSPDYGRQRKVTAKCDALNVAIVEHAVDQAVATPEELGIAAAVLIRAGRTLISFGQQTLEQLRVPPGVAHRVTQAALDLGAAASTVLLAAEDKGWGPGVPAPAETPFPNSAGFNEAVARADAATGVSP